MLKKIAIITVVLLGLTGAYGYQRYQSLDKPMNARGGIEKLTIEPGMTFKQVVAQLSQKGVLADGLVFELFARFEKADRSIKAGEYMIDLGHSPRQLLMSIQQGTLPKHLRVTIPEGYNRWQIADLLTQKGLVKREPFLTLVEEKGLEGILFPDTYFFRSDSTTPDVVQTLTQQFEKVWKTVAGTLSGKERTRIITMASLVEKESRHSDEQKKIARVFYNRLKKNMKLQTDPTCVYGKNLYKSKPHPKYCKDPKSQYSTYVIHGLPPTPISNPGRTALEAALTPFVGPDASKLLFFVARGDGSGRHRFSHDYTQHRHAVKQYIRARKQGLKSIPSKGKP